MVHDSRQVALPDGRRPADEAVPRSRLRGRGAEAQQGQQTAVGGVSKVARLGAGKRIVPEMVVASHMLVPPADARIARAQPRQPRNSRACNRLDGCNPDKDASLAAVCGGGRRDGARPSRAEASAGHWP